MGKSECQTECENVMAVLHFRNRRLDRVYFRKDFWDCYKGQRKKNWPIADWYVTRNDPTNNCGTHFGTSSLFVFRSLSGELGSLCIDVVLCQ